MSFLTPEEWVQLDKTLEGQPDRALLALGCLGGLRAMEIAHLRPGLDVSLPARTLTVQPRKGESEWRPKTDRSIRTVPISAELLRILEDHIALGYAGERYLIRAPLEDRPLSWTALARRVKRAFTDAGLHYGMGADGLTAHSLRHTFASWLVQRDVQMLKVAQLLGDTVAEVEKSYAHLLPGDLTAAVRVLDEVLDAANACVSSSES